MPAINVMTWNSRGESPAKAAFLQNLILNNPSVQGWQPDLIFIQEAQIAPHGDIWNMLAALVPNQAELITTLAHRKPQ